MKKIVFIFSWLCIVFSAKAATYYVSTTGNDSNNCINTKPCLSLSRAYNFASAGDTIEIASGNYGSQTVNARTLGSPIVTFKPASGAVVTLASLSIYASYVEFQDIVVSRGVSISSANIADDPSVTNHVTLRNVRGKSIFIIAEYVDVIGGDYGGFDACDTNNQEDIIQVWQSYPGGVASSYINFNGVTIHDITDHNNICEGLPGAGRHVDGMQILAGHHITVKNSIFYNCATSDIIARPYIDTLDNITLENNFFGPVMNPGVSLNLGSSEDVFGGSNVVRYNYIDTFSAAFSSGSMLVYGNILQTGACGSATYAYNVFIHDWGVYGCGSSYKTGTPIFIGPTPSPSYNSGIKPNYRLASTDVIAKDAGDPTRYPATDIDGRVRFEGLAPDAGAFEIGLTSIKPQAPTNLSITNP